MRRARKMAESGFYHVVMKGEADKTLFYDDADRLLYISELANVRDEYELVLHAYCLMSNHVHLLVEDPKQNLSVAMKQLSERYARHFKKKTHRTGHVFKNRFWSEPVETEAYLLCAMRYIHANPATAGICMASAYPWSSVRDYLGNEGITNTGMLLDMLGGRKGFIAFSKKEPYPAVPFPGSTFNNHLNNAEIERVTHSVVGDPNALRLLKRKERAEKILLLKRCGLTTGQITTVTGISRSTVHNDIKMCKGDSPPCA